MSISQRKSTEEEFRTATSLAETILSLGSKEAGVDAGEAVGVGVGKGPVDGVGVDVGVSPELPPLQLAILPSENTSTKAIMGKTAR
ncbi:hypothetical protein ACFLTL_00520 [Chloroflexota bacterium]